MSAQIFDLPSGCNCDNISSYNQADIAASASQDLKLASEGTTIGRDKYPHAYNDYEHFSFSSAQMPYLEFPILASEQVYSGGAPGAGRVVIGSINQDFSSAIFCAVITHDESQRNGFTECQNSGDKETEGARQEGKEVRTLLERIEL